jgi:glycosyltransferase involved in cell wall biosynthesis
MKLLHVISTMEPRSGGPCQGVRSLTPCIVEQGHTVEVVCLDEPNSDYLSTEDLCIHAVGKGQGAWRYHPALRPWLKQNLPRFDAVILNGLWQYPSYSLSQRAKGLRLPPNFVFPHGMLDPWFQRAPGRRLKAIRNWFYWKLVEQRVIARAAAVCFTCVEEMRLAREMFRPYRPQREINVGFGVTRPPRFHKGMLDALAQKCPELNGRPYFLFLGRIHPKKGVDLLIKSYAAVFHGRSSATGGQELAVGGRPPGSSPNPNGSPLPCLVVAGPGLETPYGQQLQKMVSGLCPPASVLWPGMLTGDAKWGAIYNADAFALPSHQENFGIAVVESLACGTPVLISERINIWREIGEANAGLTADDTCAGAEHLFRRWANLSTAERTMMKQSALDLYENRFSIHLAAKNLLANIQELVPAAQVS